MNTKYIEHEITEERRNELLKSFIKEFFDFNGLCKAGLFTKEIRNDYKKQAEILCRFMGLNNIYEYGSKEINCHITSDNIHERKTFITTIPSIYE